ncbi:hypothetical protein [Bradyrhizobium sp.]|uniref:hypothetical protein n=1 Tax=Bradyrhizobium sp. TaxID=376 RepID=UPI003C733F0D
MKVSVDGVPNWEFEIEEVSTGLYRLRGTHSSAASIDLTGTDPNNLVEAGKERALEVEGDSGTASRFLPEHLWEKVRDMPESSYGTTCVVVVLDDGTRIPDVHVAWGKEIVKVDQKPEVHFDVSRVVDVEFQ